MNRSRYRVGELHGIESARRRGYVAAIVYNDELALDWYGICADEGMPFVQCAKRRAYHQIDYDLGPVTRSRPNIIGLTPAALASVRRLAAGACKASPNKARHQIGETSGLIIGIPRDAAHQLARQLAAMFRDMRSYQRADVLILPVGTRELSEAER
jgi:hypothetical protein